MEDLSGIPFSEKAVQELCTLQSAQEYVLRFVSIDVKMRCLLCDMCAEGADSVLNHVLNQHTATSVASEMFTNMEHYSEPERLSAIQKQTEPSIYEDEQDTLFDFDFKPPMLDLQSEFDFQNDGALQTGYARDMITSDTNLATISIAGDREGIIKAHLNGLPNQSFCDSTEPSDSTTLGSCCHSTMMGDISVIEPCHPVPPSQISPDIYPEVKVADEEFKMNTRNISEGGQHADFRTNIDVISSNEASRGGAAEFSLNFSDDNIQKTCYEQFNVNQGHIASTGADISFSRQQSQLVYNLCSSMITRETLLPCEVDVNSSRSTISTINEEDIMDDKIPRFENTLNLGCGDTTTVNIAENKIPTEKLSNAEHSYSKVGEEYLTSNSNNAVDGNLETVNLREEFSQAIDVHKICTANQDELSQNAVQSNLQSEEVRKNNSPEKELCKHGANGKGIKSDKSLYSDSQVTESDKIGECILNESSGRMESKKDHTDMTNSSFEEVMEGQPIICTDSETSPNNGKSKKKAKSRKMDYKWKTSVVLATSAGNVLKENDLARDSQSSPNKRKSNQQDTQSEYSKTFRNSPIKEETASLNSTRRKSKRKQKKLLEHNNTATKSWTITESKGKKKPAEGEETHSPKVAVKTEKFTPEEITSTDKNLATRSETVVKSECKSEQGKTDEVKIEASKKNKVGVKKIEEPSKIKPELEKDKRPFICVYCVEEFKSIAECFKHYNTEHNDGLQTRVEKTNQNLMSENVKNRRNVYIMSRAGKPHVDDFGLGVRVDVRMLKMLAKGDKDAVKKFKCNGLSDCEDVGYCTTEDEDSMEMSKRGSSKIPKLADDVNSTISNAAELLKSKKKASDSENYRTCPLCYQKFKNDALESHIAVVHYWGRVSRNNHTSGEFVCNQCMKLFKYKKNLESHKKVVHQGKTRSDNYSARPDLTCGSCDYVTKERRRLEVHFQSKHMGLMPYKCQYCDFTSKERTAMKDHTYRHFKEKPVSCAYCEFACIQKTSMKAHLAKKHKIILPTFTSCKHLGTTFEGRLERSSILKEHNKHMIINDIGNFDVKKMDNNSLLGPTFSEKELNDQMKQAEETCEQTTKKGNSEIVNIKLTSERQATGTFGSNPSMSGLSLVNQHFSGQLPGVKVISTKPVAKNPAQKETTRPSKIDATQITSASKRAYTLVPTNESAEKTLFLPVVSSGQNGTMVVSKGQNGTTASATISMGQPMTTPFAGVLYKFTPSVTIVSSAKASTIQYKPVTSAVPIRIGGQTGAPTLNSQNVFCMAATKGTPNGYGSHIQGHMISELKLQSGQKLEGLSSSNVMGKLNH